MNSYRVSRVPRNAAGRDFVVGDVHGCFRTLDCALASLAFDGSRDRPFGVGDLVNRGPHSAEALEWIERRFTAVTLGNHDVAAFGWLSDKLERSNEEPDGWLRPIPADDYARWIDAFREMPLAVTIETQHGDVGVVHSELPDHCWAKALELLESGHGLDVALFGFPHNDNDQHHRTGPVKCMRARVHGHRRVVEVERTANRWNIDTGAGIPQLNRLSILEFEPELRSRTADVAEARRCQTAHVKKEERHAPETA